MAIRVVSLGLIENADRLFVSEHYDPVKRQTFYRPLGGGIKFGEQSEQCLRREFREEMGVELRNVTFVKCVENLFTYRGKRGHEIVMVYRAQFCDTHLYRLSEIICQEGEDQFLAKWIDIADFRTQTCVLYPAGIVELL